MYRSDGGGTVHPKTGRDRQGVRRCHTVSYGPFPWPPSPEYRAWQKVSTVTVTTGPYPGGRHDGDLSVGTWLTSVESRRRQGWDQSRIETGGPHRVGEFLARSRIGRNPDTGAGGPDGGRLSDQGSLLHDPPTSRRPSTQDQWETAPRTGTRGLPTDPEETPKPRDGSVGRTEVLQSTGPRDTTTTTKRKPNCFVWGGRPLPDEDYA